MDKLVLLCKIESHRKMLDKLRSLKNELNDPDYKDEFGILSKGYYGVGELIAELSQKLNTLEKTLAEIEKCNMEEM